MQMDQYTDLLGILLVLVLAWVALRAILRLAWKVFSLGCSLLLALGILLFLARYLSGS